MSLQHRIEPKRTAGRWPVVASRATIVQGVHWAFHTTCWGGLSVWQCSTDTCHPYIQPVLVFPIGTSLLIVESELVVVGVLLTYMYIDATSYM